MTSVKHTSFLGIDLIEMTAVSRALSLSLSEELQSGGIRCVNNDNEMEAMPLSI